MWTMNRGRLPLLRVIGTTSQKYWVLLLIITISLFTLPKTIHKGHLESRKKDSFLLQTVNECSKMIMLWVNTVWKIMAIIQTFNFESTKCKSRGKRNNTFSSLSRERFWWKITKWGKKKKPSLHAAKLKFIFVIHSQSNTWWNISPSSTKVNLSIIENLHIWQAADMFLIVEWHSKPVILTTQFWSSR